MDRILRGTQFKVLFENQMMEIRKKYRLKKSEIEILYFLSKSNQKNTATDIRNYLKMNKGHISQTVDILERKGYIRAVPDTGDKRYIHYLLTEETQELIYEIYDAWDRILQILFDGITEEEMIIFKHIAEKMEKNMDTVL